MIWSDRVPDQHCDEDAFMLLETGFEELPKGADIPSDQLQFVTTLLVRADDKEAMLGEAREWWEEHAEAALDTELLATDPRLFSEDMTESLAELGPESWSYRAHFVVFKSTSELARKQAEESIRDAALRTQ
jgi:hypothetical protein